MNDSHDLAAIDTAIATWNRAIEAMQLDIARIAKGGLPDAQLTGRLLTAIETARHQYEEMLARPRA